MKSYKRHNETFTYKHNKNQLQTLTVKRTPKHKNIIQVHRQWGAAWPEALVARKSLVLLKRMAFARSVGDMMDAVGTEITVQYTVAGNAIQMFSRASVVENAILKPMPILFSTTRKAVAMAVLCVAAGMVLDYDAERALKSVMRRSLGAPMWNETSEVLVQLLRWLG